MDQFVDGDNEVENGTADRAIGALKAR
jgi:hypothetical protein